MVSELLGHALNKGIDADDVLIDFWFTQALLIKSINDKGLFVIAMVKQLKPFYVYGGKRLTLPELYAKIKSVDRQKGHFRCYSGDIG